MKKEKQTMSDTQKKYSHLHQISRHTELLSGISSLLNWDQETYMPSGAAGIRSEQMETIAGLIHKEKTSPKFAKVLKELIDLKSGKLLAKGLKEEQQAALKEWRRDYLKEKKLPSKFVTDFAKLTSQSIVVWRMAKEKNSFSHFAPYLDRIITMCRKQADYLGYKEHPYDALLDNYEHDVTTADVKKLFGGLRQKLSQLLKQIAAKKQIDDSFLYGKFSQEKQIEFSKQLLHTMHYDMTKGRLDFSSHPFSSASHPTDSRITTRIHPTSLMSNIFVILHEGGHALYEMGLPVEHYGSPLGQAISLGMHESQSRWWETRIGQSKPFWQHFLPKLQQEFQGRLDKISLDQFYRAINKVEPSFIRVEADEVTYPLHVILRFELELALIEGTLSVRELPEAWNSKMQELLGIRPKNDAEGCLQDIHWSMGALGYFPTYTLGTLYASHLFRAFERDYPNWSLKVAKGDLHFIKEWLNSHVHQYGRRYSSKQLLEKVTEKKFSEEAFLKYIDNKYREIYSIK